jgi:hypothetical protein
MTKKQKKKKQLEEIKEKARKEINKFDFARFLFQPLKYHTTDKQISAWAEFRIKDSKSDLPNVYKLLPDLFDGDNWKYIKIHYDRYPDTTFVIASRFYFVMNSDNTLDPEKGKKYFLNKIDEVTEIDEK